MFKRFQNVCESKACAIGLAVILVTVTATNIVDIQRLCYALHSYKSVLSSSFPMPSEQATSQLQFIINVFRTWCILPRYAINLHSLCNLKMSEAINSANSRYSLVLLEKTYKTSGYNSVGLRWSIMLLLLISRTK